MRSLPTGLWPSRWKRPGRAMVMGAFAVAWSGCTTSPPGTDATDNDATPWLQQGETIVLLRSPQFLYDWTNEIRATRIDSLDCARQALIEEGVGDRLLSAEDFKRTAFPNLSPDSAPTDPESIRLLLTHPTLLRRIAPLNLRYLVYVMSETERRETIDVWGGIGGAHGAAIAGYKEWEQSSKYSFLVVDAKAIEDVGSADARSAGTGWQTMGFVIVPFALGYESATEKQACAAMSRKLRAVFQSEGVP